MKKCLIFICAMMLLIGVCVRAESNNEINEIKKQLENKTIKDYDIIITPLKEAPENFNVNKNDDLSTLEFGEGVQGYGISKQNMEKAVNKKAEKIAPYLIKKDKWYFPIILSGRAVAVAQIVKVDGVYEVLCVGSGYIFDNLVREQENLDLSEAKYVTAGTMINGFVVDKNNKEIFVNLDSAVNESHLYNADSQEKSVVELFSEKFNEAGTENEITSGSGYGNNSDIMNNQIFLGAVLILILSCGIVVMIKSTR